MSTAMNERKIIDRKYLCDLAKEVGLTTLDLEALGVLYRGASANIRRLG